MGQLRLSVEAESDLSEIVAYTIAAWGAQQADLYLGKLEEGLSLIAENPGMGRLCKSIQSGLFRMEIEHHVASYVREPDGVLIVRVLHHSMLPNRHL